MTDAIIEVESLSKHFVSNRRLPWSRRTKGVSAVRAVSFRILQGRTLGLVGETGCGKTTTGRLILDLDSPSAGRVLYRGRPLRELKRQEYRQYRAAVQAVFQDPSTAFDPRTKIKTAIEEPLKSDRSLGREGRARMVQELLEEVGLSADVSSSFPNELSGGMKQRVAIAQALALRPELVVLDEPVSSLDVSIRAQIMNLLKDLQNGHGTAYLLIAHDLATVSYLADDVAAMYAGRIVEQGTTREVFASPAHPYTVALISASGGPNHRVIEEAAPVAGEDQRPACDFQSRCWLYRELGQPGRCREVVPELRSVAEGTHLVACHFSEEMNSHIIAEQSLPADRPTPTAVAPSLREPSV